jgi:DNA-binding MarR family transcriptional regulator
MRDQYIEEAMARMEAHFPGFDHSTMQMIVALSNTYRILLSVMDRALAEYKITPQSMDVLVALYVRRGRDVLLGEIGELLLVSPANVTGLVEGLVKKGLAIRKEHPDDRRKRLAEITPKGVALVEVFIPESARYFQAVFAAISPQEKQELVDRLGQVFKSIFPFWEKRELPNLTRLGPTPGRS